MAVSADEDTRLSEGPDGVHQGRLLALVTVTLIVVAMLIGWMFGGFSMVHLVLPDDAVAPAKVATAQKQTPPSSQQLHAWLAQLESPLDALLIQRDNIAAAAAKGDMVGTERACQAGQAVVPQLQTLLPSPDATLTTALRQTLDDFGSGFSACLAGIRNQDVADIEMASVHLYRANNDLRTLMAVIARELNDVDSENQDVVPI